MEFFNSPSLDAFWGQQLHSQYKQVRCPFFWWDVFYSLLHCKCYNRVHLALSSESDTFRLFVKKDHIEREERKWQTWPTCGSPSESIEWQPLSRLLFLNIVEDRSAWLPSSVKSIVSVCQNNCRSKSRPQFLAGNIFSIQITQNMRKLSTVKKWEKKKRTDTYIVRYKSNLTLYIVQVFCIHN